MYQSGTWLLSILWTVVCSWDFFTIGWLSAGYWLVISLNLYTSRHSHILLCTLYQSGTWLLLILWAVLCSQDFLVIGWLLAGYWLAIGWLYPKINTLPDIVILYYVPKWHMAAITTLGCSAFTRFFGYQLTIGWLLPGYGPKSIHFKT